MPTQKIFDLASDGSVLNCTYIKITPWNWSKKITSTIVHLKVVSLTKHRIELHFGLTVTEGGKGIYIYKGKRIFRKSKPLITRYLDLK